MNKWRVLDQEISGPHSIVSNGEIYIAEDTGKNAIRIYREIHGKGLCLKQIITSIGIRPHRSIYCSKTDTFYIISSLDQTIFSLGYNQGKVFIKSAQLIPELQGQYCRSITIWGDLIYFIGNYKIVIYKLCRNSLTFISTINLNRLYIRPNDLYFFSNQSAILTCTPKKAFLFKNLSEIENGTATDISSEFLGTPYYLSYFDDKIWIPEINQYSRICSFDIVKDKISFPSRKVYFNSGPPSPPSILRKNEYPL